MIPNKDKNKERMKQASFIPKPKSDGWFGFSTGDVISIGLHQNWRKNSNKNKKKKR